MYIAVVYRYAWYRNMKRQLFHTNYVSYIMVLVLLCLIGLPLLAPASRLHQKRYARKNSHGKGGDERRFILADQFGRKIDIYKQAGKVLFINFWALSCPPCKAEMPGIDSLASHFRSDTTVMFLAVDLDRETELSIGFMKEKGLGLLVYTVVTPIPQEFYHGKIPTTVIVDKRGKVLYFNEGEAQYNTEIFIEKIGMAGK